jgi:hypothetical protein
VSSSKDKCEHNSNTGQKRRESELGNEGKEGQKSLRGENWREINGNATTPRAVSASLNNQNSSRCFFKPFGQVFFPFLFLNERGAELAGFESWD